MEARVPRLRLVTCGIRLYGARMRVISKRPIREFRARHPESQAAMTNWYRRLNACAAESFSSLRQSFPSADYIDGFVIFDVGGNN